MTVSAAGAPAVNSGFDWFTDLAAFARLSHSVLHNRHTFPELAEDGTIDGPHLTDWVRRARLAFSDGKRTAIGDEPIGHVLASSTACTDGVWPAERVREIIENIGNLRLDTGQHIGKTNKRGITTRGVFDGGDRERDLEKKYRENDGRRLGREQSTGQMKNSGFA